MLTIITGQVQGNVAVMRKAIKALDILELSEAEQRQVGFATLPDGALRWNNDVPAFDLEIKDKEAAALVQRVFSEYQGWQGTDARRVLALAAKLGLGAVEDKEDTLT